ncbi:hypothetical protein, partial [Gemmatimonas sp.]|uniref:hypothetical protein n=1 Tax=Gemmatimonas sp. TaxID=1962908 RepID=UPI00333F0D6B
MKSLLVVPVAVRRTVLALVTVATALAAVVSPAAAQTSTARITGVVRGEDGAVVAGVVVTARSLSTNITRSASTSERGFYV